MRAKIGIFFLLPFLSACIGIDYKDDPIIDEKIEILTPQQVALMPGETTHIEAVYFDRYGIMQNAVLAWSSSNNDVAVVNEDGVVTAITQGQAIVQATYAGVISTAIDINVVLGPADVAYVEVLSPPKTVLEVGEEVALSVKARNIDDEELDLTDKAVEWFSENAAIVSVDGNGNVAALEKGLAGIHAKVNGVKSNSIHFTVGAVRTGTFMSAGGYEATGMASLKLDNSNNVILELSADFETSFALGTFIYLSNTTSGAGTRSNGLEIMQITTNGAHTFDVTSISPTIGLHDYRYVIVLCKPASVTFGFADMD